MPLLRHSQFFLLTILTLFFYFPAPAQQPGGTPDAGKPKTVVKNAKPLKKFKPVLVANLTAGTTGIGLEVKRIMSPELALRAGGSFLPQISVVRTSATDFDNSTKAQGNFSNAHLLLEYAPFPKTAVRLVGGAAYIFELKAVLDQTPTGSYSYGDITFTPDQIGTIHTLADWKGTALYGGFSFFKLYIMKNLKLYVLALCLFSGLTTFAQEKNELDIRLRAIGIFPQESASIGVIGGGIDISNAYVPELDFTYFFAKNLSAELILGTSRHKVKTLGSDLSAIGGSTSADVDLGKVWLLPPTLTLQYHIPAGEAFKPYVGAGVNYTIFYNADKGSVVEGISYKNRFSFAAQAGIDYDISKKMFLNVDLKKLLLSTKAAVNAANLTPADNPSLAPVLGNINADVKINPWIVGIGVGYRIK